MKVATLGPAGTFSQLAAEKFADTSEPNSLRHAARSPDDELTPDAKTTPNIETTPNTETTPDTEIKLYSHLQRCLQALPDEAERVVVPLENVSEGFVPIVLDYLVSANIHICQELHLPIAFDACAQVQDAAQITRLYVQFVARGQCREFIDRLGDIEIIATQSNTESLHLAEAYGAGAAAIIPAHFSEQVGAQMTWRQQQVQDYAHNETRFVMLAQGEIPSDARGTKTSIMVINDDDRPGLLEKVLHCFSTRKLNLSSIVSRPTGEAFGRYHFFIDVQCDIHNIAMQGALKAVAEISRLKVLGCY